MNNRFEYNCTEQNKQHKYHTINRRPNGFTASGLLYVIRF